MEELAPRRLDDDTRLLRRTLIAAMLAPMMLAPMMQ